MTPAETQMLFPLIILVVFMALRWRRMMRPRRFRVSTLWIGPGLVLVGIIFVLSLQPAPTVGHMAALVGIALAGGALGWVRAKLTKVAFDPVAGEVSLRGTPYGVLFLIGLIAARTGLRVATMQHPEWGIDLNKATDYLLFFGFGIVAGYALELYLAAGRVRRLAVPSA
jgi:hypothetical protein